MKRKSLVVKLFNLQSGKCFYCHEDMSLETTNRQNSATIDHVVPKCKGGKKDIFNTVAACKDCNTRKADTALVVFMSTVARKRQLVA